MSLHAWAKSRQVPHSTAQRAVKAGRRTREPGGTVNPEQVDLAWLANTRLRIHRRVQAVRLAGTCNWSPPVRYLTTWSRHREPSLRAANTEPACGED